MSNIFKDTVYDKEKYLKEQEEFSVLTNTSDIFKNVKKSPIIIEEIKENEKIIVDNPEVVDFVNDKLSKFLEIREQNWQNAIDNLEEYTNYQKKYLLSKENIHNNIVNSVTDKKKAISFDLKSNEFEEKYKWYLEQDENSELQKTNYSKVQNMDRHWDNGVSVLEKIEKENYIQNASLSLYANENRDLKEYVFGLLNNKINDFESSVYDNQKGFYFEKDFDKANELYSEKEEVVENVDVENVDNIDLKMDKINKEYEDLTQKNTNILEILSNIEEINLSSLKRDIERDRTESIDTTEDISKSFSNTLIVKEVEKKFDIADLGKINTFNFNNNKNPEFDINSKLERTVNLKKIDKLGNELSENDISFNKEDIKPISKELKELIKDRENALDFNRPYVSFEDFNDITNQNYNEKKALCKFLNMVDITDIEITPSRLNIEDTGNEYLASVITPQYIASFETTKIGKDKVDNIILELSESMESKYDLDLIEKIYGNSESKYDLSVRDNIRKMGKDFYADFIFNKYIGFEDPVKLEKETVIYLEKSNLEKINDREKVLDLELLTKDIEKEKEIKYEEEKDFEINSENRKDEIKIDISETRERVFSDLAQYPLVRNNLIMLEENYSKEKIYGQYLDYEDNLDNSILLTIDYLVREELKIGKSEEIEDRKALDILENANARDLDDCLYMFNKFKQEKEKEREVELEKDFENSDETKVSRATGREKSERTIKDIDKNVGKNDVNNDFEDTYKKFFEDDEVEI